MKGLLKVTAGLLGSAVVCGAVYAASGVSGASVDGRSFHDKRPVITERSITPGAYDPHGDYTNDPNSKIRAPVPSLGGRGSCDA